MNNNKTVAGCVRRIRKNILSAGCEGRVHCDYGELMKAFDAIEATHKSELTKKDDERLTVVATYETVIAGKDAEIEKLKFDNMRLKSEQRTAGEVIIEQTNKVEARDAEIARLRELVGEMADELTGALDDIDSLREYVDSDYGVLLRVDNHVETYDKILAKAREVVK